MKIARIAGWCLLGAAAAAAQTVNCLVAVVNGHLITLVDVQVVAEFGLAPTLANGATKDPRWAALEALIDRKVVLDMTRDARSVDREESAAALEKVRQTLGEEGFARRLRALGLEADDLRPYIEEALLFDKALALRFTRQLPVPRTEIEKHYREVYIPGEARRGVAPESLDRVAPLLEARLRERTLRERTRAWIKDLRDRADIVVKKDCLK